MSEEAQIPETPAAVEQTPNQPVKTIGDDGNFTQEFRDSLPDDLGKHSSFDKYTSATDYFKGSINSAKLNGQKAEDFWSSEEPDVIARRNEIMGVPKEASGYEYDPVEFAEGMPVEAINKRVEEFKAFAKENNMPASFVKKALEFDLNGANDQFISMQESQANGKSEAEAQLKSEWKGEKYQYNIDKARNALEHLGLGDWVENPAFGNDPRFIKDVFEKIVPLISDDTIIEARQSHNMATISDSLDAVEDKISAFAGERSSATYKNLLSERMKFIEQMHKQ